MWLLGCIHSANVVSFMPSAAMTKKVSREVDSPVPPDEILFGTSAVMAEVRRVALKVCGNDVPVLLCGLGGTGKETLALWIHSHSACASGQFVKVNCSAIPGTLLESELFGYEKGAFTGANGSKPGRVEQADKGTLFLDEIADLDIGLQSKLLHFLQDGCFSRLGDDIERHVDVRLMCATNRDLEEEIACGRFRADLFYRINVVRFQLPPLRDRREDISQLAEYFQARYERQFSKGSGPLDSRMIEYLQNQSWPGNVRELSNTIARHVLIGLETFRPDIPLASERRAASGSREPGAPLKTVAKNAIKEMERTIILEALRTNRWNRRKTALDLKISYRALIYKIRELGLTARGAKLNSTPKDPAMCLQSPGTVPQIPGA
ncbi:MAG: hypothetical protein NVS9B4_12920 [Candidatus Acidiferrum sp.]